MKFSGLRTGMKYLSGKEERLAVSFFAPDSFLPQLLVFTQFLFHTRFHEIFGGFRQAGFIVPERKKGGRPAYSA